jgi:hypothetical protein
MKKAQTPAGPKKIGEVTQEQIDGWKKQLDVKEIPFVEVMQEGTEEISVFYLKPANRDQLALIMSRYNAGQIVEAGEAAIANCWLGGDERIKNPVGLRQERTGVRAAQLAYACVTLPEGWAGVKK